MTLPASAALIVNAASAALPKLVASAVAPAAAASVQGSAIASATAAHHSWSSILSADYLFANPQVAGSLLSIAGSALVGVLTLFGVGITLWVNRVGLRKQLKAAEEEAQRNRDFNIHQASEDREHARKEAVIDRENSANERHVGRLMEMRKLLYQTLIEEHQKAVALIAALPTVPLAEISEAPTKLLGYAAAAHKTMIISEGATSVAATDAHAKVNEIMFSVFPRLIPMAIARAKFDDATKRLAQQNAIFVALNAEFQALMPGDSAALERFKVKAIKSGEAIEAISAQQQKSGARRNVMLAEYQDQVMGQLSDVHRAFAKFLALARAELGLPGGAEELLLQTETMLSQVAAVMRNSRRTLRRCRAETMTSRPGNSFPQRGSRMCVSALMKSACQVICGRSSRLRA
jgi:hypothetical protein